MAALQDKIDSQNLWDLESQIEMAMDALRCPDGDADVNNLSGGEKRRVALCKLLLEAPDLLLLDEPTNHLDAESVAWLERHLREYTGTVVLVTHDRYFLDNVTGWILELDRGHGIPHEGNYSTWLDVQQKRLASETESGRSARPCARTRRRVDQIVAACASGEVESPHSGLRRIAVEVAGCAHRARRRSSFPPVRGSEIIVVEANDVAKAYGDRCCSTT